MLLYALGANFVFVLYTSMAQITGIAPTAIIVLVLLGRTLRHSSPTDHTLPSLRATNPSGLADGRTSNRSLAPPRGNGRGLSSTLDLESRLDNSQPIRIDIKTSTEVSPHETLDTELDSLPQKVPRERQDLTTWK
ncbi:hypothetical protein CPB86DRAFT_790883 [Serendipita vermifera]|nr:hypothetical protein CPB86DRAFT_790883 [Serendipita vermifera]